MSRKALEQAEEEEDFADILDISLPSLFSIAPIAFSTPTPTSLHTYYPPPPHPPIKLRLPNPAAEIHTKLQANHLWLSAIYLADLIHRQELPVKGKCIAELGAAAGLPGISACRFGANVVGSDWGDAGILEAMKDNFERNCSRTDEGLEEAGGEGRNGQWAVRGHEWGTNPSTLLNALRSINGDHGDRFDALLLADTLWVTDAHSALLDSIFNLLRPSGMAHIAAGLHTGRGPIKRFIEAAEKRGARAQNCKEVLWKAEGEWDEGSAVTQSLEEERGIVVYFELILPG